MIQKGENPGNNDEEINLNEDDYSYLKNSNKIYYNLTHNKKEKITVQP